MSFPEAPAVAPLSHHEILRLVAPFSRAGLQVDLAASDRAARRVAFRPRALPAPAGAAPADEPWAEHWALQDTDRGWRVTRSVHRGPPGQDAPARVEAVDEEPGQALAAAAAVPPAQLFLPLGQALPPAALHWLCTAREGLQLRGAQAQAAGLALELTMTGVRGYPATLQLRRAVAGHPRELPDDLLEVLGRAWSRLTPWREGWECSIALDGDTPRRNAGAQQRLALTAQHLARTLAAPPRQFHRQHRLARWRIGLARGSALAIGLAVVGVALVMQHLGVGSGLGLLANAAPPLLMVWFFMRREMARIELPRWPRPPRPDSWLPAAADPAPGSPATVSPALPPASP